ncbi:uncharacterized protein BX664DRAFT_324366 [Halteromyces radiatus]|uniref:uncharacterized protein n=1 Tax=Halteromyces radiatus TaxID=101107 RepID=UPI00221EF214|nr:uncharacterized protein BX664DRAFT_324366 [Halteromyces radiatus]KAI8096603.1 hypothetical protein BX664DRAFT_324366 [Halteromyces radiatus]
MGKKPLVSKTIVMTLAMEESARAKQQQEEDWEENGPTIDPNSNNLFDELCTASKQGDLEKVESLVKNFGANINKVDEWQCSALYWACLCGNYDIVKFLLENGAQCDRNTFQGERCLYGALTSDIRTLLLSYKITKAVDTNQPYLAFLSDLLYEHPFNDLSFTIRLPTSTISTQDDNIIQHSFSAHRFLLAARSQFFQRQLLQRWHGQQTIKLSKSLVDPVAFAAVLRYLYTGQLGDIDQDTLRNMVFVGKHLDLPELSNRCQEELETMNNESNAIRAYDAKEMAKIRLDFEKFLQRILYAAAYIEQQQEGSYLLKERLLPEDSSTDPRTLFADVAVRLDDDNTLFPTHKAFLCRSTYFRNMLVSTFAEASASPSTIIYQQDDIQLALPVVGLTNVPSDIFQYVLEFLYTDRCTIPIDLAYEVLLAADLLFLDRLKALAAITLTGQDEPCMDIYDLMQIALDLNVDRLEQWCTQYFAKHLDDFAKDPAFYRLIRQSAQSISGRQETDSIPFIDELRYYLGKMYCIEDADLNAAGKVNEDYKEDWTDLEMTYNLKLDLLDEILESLGLEA